MPEIEQPLPISATQLKQYLSGLASIISNQAALLGMSEDDICAEFILAAQREVETTTGIKYFVTRFCTRELATQESLTQGTDFDEYHSARDYVVADWRSGTGRMQMPWGPVCSVEKLRLSLIEGAKVADVPGEWLQNDDFGGQIHVIPSGLGGGTTIYFNFFTLYPMYRSGLMTGIIPNLVHIRYTAGLVERLRVAVDDEGNPLPYDPQVRTKNTRWEQTLVAAFQKAIAQLAAAMYMEALVTELDHGGVSIGFDGLSESVNPMALHQRADMLRQRSSDWAYRMRDQYRGIPIAFV